MLHCWYQNKSQWQFNITNLNQIEIFVLILDSELWRMEHTKHNGSFLFLAAAKNHKIFSM